MKIKRLEDDISKDKEDREKFNNLLETLHAMSMTDNKIAEALKKYNLLVLSLILL